MLPEGGSYPITIYQGGAFRLRFALTEDNGTPIPLTGYTAQAQLRTKQKVGADLLATFECTVDPTAGEITIYLPSAVTATFTRKSGFYDLFLIDADGEAYMIVQGQARIDLGVTVTVPAG